MRGPMSRMKKVPVKCRTCGKIKYNVICEQEQPAPNPVQEQKKEETKQEPKKREVPRRVTYKKPKHYSYLESVVKKQNQIAGNAYMREQQKD